MRRLHNVLFCVLTTVYYALARAPRGGVLSVPIHATATPTKKIEEFVAFEHASYNQTKIEIRILCNEVPVEYNFTVQWTLRSSPCHRELLAVANGDLKTLETYFEKSNAVVNSMIDEVKSILFYQSERQTIHCKHNDQVTVLSEAEGSGNDWKHKLQRIDLNGRRQRRAMSENKAVQGAGTKHPNIITIADADYLLIVNVKPINSNVSVTLLTSWEGPYGYLSAIDFPLLPFYAVMCGVYALMALIWLCISACYWRDLLRIQFWIGAVIMLGMLEKAVFVSEYKTINSTGVPVFGVIQFAEFISAAKRTLARMLIIIVSVGYGVVKPRLGDTLHKIVAVGGLYFMLSCIEANVRVTRMYPEKEQQKQLAMLPLIITDVAIFYWIMTALANTMRALRLRRNQVKLSLYRHFTNTLVFAAIGSIIFMIWALAKHRLSVCIKDWKELWVDDAFWHLFFSIILIVIMILWRPSANNQRYAFTPLLDEHSDDDEDGAFLKNDATYNDKIAELFNDAAFTTGAGGDNVKIRAIPRTTTAENRHHRSQDEQTDLERELRWVEENIPSSLADKLVASSDEEVEQTKFEVSKMQ